MENRNCRAGGGDLVGFAGGCLYIPRILWQDSFVSVHLLRIEFTYLHLLIPIYGLFKICLPNISLILVQILYHSLSQMTVDRFLRF